MFLFMLTTREVERYDPVQGTQVIMKRNKENLCK